MTEGTDKAINHDTLLFWHVPEFDKHDKTRIWYIAAIISAVGALIYSMFSSNFLFAVIIVIAAFIMILRDGQEPDMIKVGITYEGVEIGSRFYDYDELKNFSIVYKPKLDVKKLYFEFKSPLRHRMSVAIDSINPLIIREILVKYLPEDTERTDQPVSEALAKLFKL